MEHKRGKALVSLTNIRLRWKALTYYENSLIPVKKVLLYWVQKGASLGQALVLPSNISWKECGLQIKHVNYGLKKYYNIGPNLLLFYPRN
jgi:hypothetical protein